MKLTWISFLVVLLVSSISGRSYHSYFDPDDATTAASVDDVKDKKRNIELDCQDGNRVNTTLRLLSLRQEMQQHQLEAYYVPLDDVGRRTWISGFSGSNGDAIVTKESALLWTDGRYFLQASQQLDCNWQLMKMGMPNVPTYLEYLLTLPEGSSIGIDPQLVGADTWIQMSEKLAEKSVSVKSLDTNLIDQIWTEANGRPPLEHKLIVPHNILFAGMSWTSKLSNLRQTLENSGVKAMVITELDEIAWFFNLRGEGQSINEGLMHSPLFESIALVTMEDVYLWIHMDKMGSGVLEHLTPAGCQVQNACTILGDYKDAMEDLKQWKNELQTDEKVLLSKPSTYLTGASYAIYKAFDSTQIQFQDSPLLISKNVKNERESEGMKNAHVRDAVAVCQFAAHLQQVIENGASNWTELSASQLLLEYRKAQDMSKGASFTTIAAFGANSAVIHYTPTPETDTNINMSNLFLVDSGGQYLDGTTDITRTFHYGTPSNEQVEMYTRVLMGAIDLASSKIPINTKDGAVDLVTRQHLFEKGLNYRHGTGHGIGSYLKVHEGPINVHLHSGKKSTLTGSFAPNMFFSDEPGYYQDGAFGIRLETILRVTSMELENNTYGDFVQFEPVTLVPFEPKLTDYSLMTVKQLEWLNTYNELIINQVRPKVPSNDQRTLAWLDFRTAFINPRLSYQVSKWSEV